MKTNIETVTASQETFCEDDVIKLLSYAENNTPQKVEQLRQEVGSEAFDHVPSFSLVAKKGDSQSDRLQLVQTTPVTVTAPGNTEELKPIDLEKDEAVMVEGSESLNDPITDSKVEQKSPENQEGEKGDREIAPHIMGLLD